MRRLLRPTVLVFALALYSQGQERKAVFQDEQSGVAFSYSASWKPVKQFHSFMPPLLAISAVPPGFQPKVVLEFVGLSSAATQTNFSAMNFAYSSSLTSPSACAEPILQLSGRSVDQIDSVVLHGVKFNHLVTGGAAACHENETNFYWTCAASRCFIFETDLLTICPGVNDKRSLTQSELAHFREQLQAVLRSIQLSKN